MLELCYLDWIEAAYCRWISIFVIQEVGSPAMCCTVMRGLIFASSRGYSAALMLFALFSFLYGFDCLYSSVAACSRCKIVGDCSDNSVFRLSPLSGKIVSVVGCMNAK